MPKSRGDWSNRHGGAIKNCAFLGLELLQARIARDAVSAAVRASQGDLYADFQQFATLCPACIT
jgi:hypothetical protein